MKFSLKRIPRGENSGKGFFISTFRFDLPLAQSLEKIALANGLSMSSVINQVLQQFVDAVDVPDNIKPVKTAHATTWGNSEDAPAPKKAKKARKVVVEEDEEEEEEKPKRKAKKVAKVAPKKAAKKARVVVEEDDDEEDEPAPKKKVKKAAAGVLGKLKKKKKSVDDEVPEDD